MKEVCLEQCKWRIGTEIEIVTVRKRIFLKIEIVKIEKEIDLKRILHLEVKIL